MFVVLYTGDACTQLAAAGFAPGKPPPVAYVCGTMLIVRFDRDYSTEWPSLAARHDALSTPCECAELGDRVRAWATTVAPDSLAPNLAYQVLSDWLFMASHRCVG